MAKRVNKKPTPNVFNPPTPLPDSAKFISEKPVRQYKRPVVMFIKTYYNDGSVEDVVRTESCVD